MNVKVDGAKINNNYRKQINSESVLTKNIQFIKKFQRSVD